VEKFIVIVTFDSKVVTPEVVDADNDFCYDYTDRR